jgi:hypothetical protein
MTNEVLFQLSNKKVSPRTAYKTLYPENRPSRVRRAHFIKLRVIIPEEKGVTRFLALLFLLPTPMFMVRMIFHYVKFESGQLPISKKELIDLIAVKGVLISVQAHSGEIIYIKTL